MILLNALEQKDQKDLDSDTIITMPVSQEDHTLAQKLDEINQLDHKDYLLPIKMTGRFHWQLIKISQGDGKIVCGLYNTDGKVTPPDNNLFDQIQRAIPTVERIDPKISDWHQWELPAQKNVNCGLVVA